jgi:predicted amidohydrolase
MKLALIQFSPVMGDVEKTIGKLAPLLEKSKRSRLIVLPELANSGYNFAGRGEAFKLSEHPRNSEFVDFLSSFCRKNDTTIITGFNERSGRDIFNTALVINKNGIVGKYRKIHLFMNEKDIFNPGDKQPGIYEVDGVKFGLLICFDWIFPEIWRVLALAGVDLICHPSNLVLPGKAQQAIPVQAMMNKIYIATANRIGTEGNLTFTGNSIIADPDGKVIASASPDREEVLFADIDIIKSRNKMATPRNHVFDDRRPEFYGEV